MSRVFYKNREIIGSIPQYASSSPATGYTLGGTNASSTLFHIDGFNMLTETSFAVNIQLSDGARYGVAGLAATYRQRGYACGGYTTSMQSTIDGLQFSDESSVNPSATLGDGAREFLGDVGVNSNDKGYCAGGVDASALRAYVDGLQFSDETGINPAMTMADGARYGAAGVSSLTKGYWGGGNVGPSGNNDSNVIDGINFADETSNNPATTLNDTDRRQLASSNSAVVGYFMGGYDASRGGSSQCNEIDGINFSNEAAVAVTATLPEIGVYGGAGVSSSYAGYVLCGFTYVGGADSSAIQGLIFATEATINPSSTMTAAKGYVVGTQSGGYL